MHSLKNRIIAFLAVIAIILLVSVQAMAAATGTHTPVTGVTVSVSGATDNSMSNGAVTVTAKGSGGLWGLGASSKTATITISHSKAKSANISFDWTATSVNQLTIDGTVYSGENGSFSKMIEPTESITVQIVTDKNSTTNTLVMKNFSVTEVADSSNVTVLFDSGNTVTVEEATVESGEVVSVTEKGATFSASATNFVAWIDTETNEILSKTAQFLYQPTGDKTIKAVYGPNARFMVGIKLFETLEAANTAASTGSVKTIVLANNGTLPAGNYTISTGVTLLIPRDDANTVDTTVPGNDGADTYTYPSVYRTLTMENGANITVDGAISVAGKHGTRQPSGGTSYSYVNGAPSGPLGYIDMQEGSKITVNDKAFLYAWGYIIGKGTVDILSGGTVYEDFQIRDWRGGTAVSSMVGNSKDVFPLSQYYVQNVQVPMTLSAGAKEIVCTSVSITAVGVQTPTPTFIGSSDGLIHLTSGTLTKDYDESTDRLVIDLRGNFSFDNLNITLNLGLLIGSKSIDSKDYVLPFNSNITINIHSGSNVSINQDIAFLPGTIVKVDSGATCTLGEGNRIYIYDADEWSGYCGPGNVKLNPVIFAPGKTHNRTAADLVDAKFIVNGTMDASKGYVYTTAGGANIISEGGGIVNLQKGSETNTYQSTQGGSEGKTIYFSEIPITSAKLKNGDGSYVDTATNTYTYCGDCLQWLCETNHGHATNVELGNSLNMYFAFWSDKVTEDTKGNFYVVLSYPDGNGGTVDTLPIYSTQWMSTDIKISEAKAQSAYVVAYKGLAAKQMCDTVTITLYDAGNNNAVVYTWSNSIQNYAMRMLEDHSNNEELRTLLVDMLNYGAACQKHFAAVEGKTIPDENLANALLTNDQKEWATSTPTWSEDMPTGHSDFYANLVTTGHIQFAITPKTGTISTSSYSFRNHWNTKDVTGTLLYNEEENYYYISKLYVADAKQKITITVNGTQWEDSIEAYCKRMIDNGKDTYDVFTAFIKFSNSAKKYLEEGVRV